MSLDKFDLHKNNDFDDFDDFDNAGSSNDEVDLASTITPEPTQEVIEQPTKKGKAVKEKKVKEKKVKVSKKSEQRAEEEPVVKPDMILYLIIDKPVFGVLNYFRESGLKVSNMFDNIKDAKDAVLMQSEPTRIIVIDTGTGKFTTTTMRAELIDMLGISDEHNRTTVFYTDSVLKIDTNRALGRSGKNIDWIQYKSTAIAVATILSYNENYIYDLEDGDEQADSEYDILNFKGLAFRGEETPRHNISGFSSDAIMVHLVSNMDGALPGYEVKL